MDSGSLRVSTDPPGRWYERYLGQQPSITTARAPHVAPRAWRIEALQTAPTEARDGSVG
jgi:hypothetical protein